MKTKRGVWSVINKILTFGICKIKEKEIIFCPLGTQRNDPADVPAMKSVWNKSKKINK